MIPFAPLRTKRHTIQHKELSISQIRKLLAIPDNLHEARTTEFIRLSCDSESNDWTAQERMLCVAHYISHVDSGDFVVTEAGDATWKFSHYWQSGDYPEDDVVKIGEVANDQWECRPLLGKHTMAIEELQGSIEGITGYLHWDIGRMAAQLLVTGEDPGPDDNRYDEWLQSRIKTFTDLPESDFMRLWYEHRTADAALSHFFKLGADNQGMYVHGQHIEGVGDAPPARFPVSTCISEPARQICS